MKYYKIKLELGKRGIPIKEFCQKIKVSEQGFHQMIRNHSMKIDILEAISKELNVNIGFWFYDNYYAQNEDVALAVSEELQRQNNRISISEIRQTYRDFYLFLNKYRHRLIPDLPEDDIRK